MVRGMRVGLKPLSRIKSFESDLQQMRRPHLVTPDTCSDADRVRAVGCAKPELG